MVAGFGVCEGSRSSRRRRLLLAARLLGLVLNTEVGFICSPLELENLVRLSVCVCLPGLCEGGVKAPSATI